MRAFIIGYIVVGWLFVCWLFWDQERELRKCYKMFGTTGFWDVDQRMRRRKQ